MRNRPPRGYFLRDKNAPKLSRKSAVKNIFWMYGRLWKYSPGFLIMVVLEGIFRGINGAVELLYV